MGESMKVKDLMKALGSFDPEAEVVHEFIFKHPVTGKWDDAVEWLVRARVDGEYVVLEFDE